MSIGDSFFRQTVAEIYLENLRHNLRELRTLLEPQSFLCPMVKANAYGHDDVAIASTLEGEGVKHLGVGLIEEGVRLREAGIKIPIIVFGTFDLKGLREMEGRNLTPVISSWDQWVLASSFQFQRSIQVHLKFNTGMNRLGIPYERASEIFQEVKDQKKIQVEGVCTHLMQGEDINQTGSFSKKQMERFQEVVDVFSSLSPLFHIYNSVGLINAFCKNKKPLQWGGRLGLALYGINPVASSQMPISLKPVMNLKSNLSAVHNLNPGERISYGGTWEAQRESHVGVVPIGYADGYLRALSNSGEALFRGMRAPVIGHVCMDYLMLDLTDAVVGGTEAQVGEEVVLFGEQNGKTLNVEELAHQAGTISYELISSVGLRVPRLIYGRSPQ